LNLANNKEFLTDFLERLSDTIGVLFADDEDHPKAIVERAIHLALSDAADLLNQIEYWRYLPTRALDESPPTLGQHAREISGDAAAGDMGRPFDGMFGKQLTRDLRINPRRLEQLFAQRSAEFGNSLTDFQAALLS
jgi:hypothetical protein